MSKEKIIGLSVIGVLTATLAGVVGWRMLGGKAASREPAPAIATDSTAQAAGQEANAAGPTVLASATSSGSDSITDRLSGKTKIKGGWETASPASSAPVDPTLPAGTQANAASDGATYDATASASDAHATAGDHERHPSFMPRETAATAPPEEGRYASDAESEIPPATDELAAHNSGEVYPSESTLEVPNELTPDPNALASTEASYPTSTAGDAAGSYGTPEQEVMQIVEHQPIAPAQLTPRVEPDPAAEQAAQRAADDARFAQAYAKEQEKVAIAESSLEPQPSVAQVANEVPHAAATSNTAPAPRFSADARYAPVAANEPPAETLTKNTAALEATVPVASGQVPPQAGYEATPAANPAPSYRESVYREPAAVSGVGSAPIASSLKSPAVGTTQAPANDPYAAQAPAEPAYGSSTRTAAVSTSSVHNAVAEKHVPQRENSGKYYVEPGDSFWIISKKVYGNGGFFKVLQEHNRARFITPSNLQVGDEVLTPTTQELRELYSGLCPKERIAKPGSPAAMQASHVPVSQPGSVRDYEVQAGDTLFDIARYELGDAKRWPEIYQLNRVAIGADIDHVKPGTKLVLPMDAPLEAAPEGEGYQGDVLTRKPGAGLR